MKASKLPKTRDSSRSNAAWFRSVACAAVMVTASFLISPKALDGQQQTKGFGFQRGSDSRAASQPEDGATEKTMSLNHFRASWTSVLEEVASEAGCELVMPDVPPGHFSRRDTNHYSVADAIRILNSDLEKKGFQVALRGKYLLVLDLETTRSRYPQPVIPQRAAMQPERTAESAADLTVRSPEQQKFHEAVNGLEQAASTKVNPRGGSPVRQVDYQQQSETISPLQPVENDPDLLRIFRIPTGNQKASLIAQKVFAACGTDAILLKPTADQLLAYQVRLHRPFGRQTQDGHFIAISVGKSDRELTVESPASIIEPVNRLVQTLAAASPQDREFVQLISVTGDAGATATKIRSSLSKVAWQQSTDELPQQTDLELPQADRTQELPQVQQAVQPQSANLRAIIEQIRGDVKVVTIDELGVIILQGTEADIAAVKTLIAEIEKAAQTELQMRIFPLKNATADELAEVVNLAIQSVLQGKPATGSATAQSATNPQIMPSPVGGQMQIATSVMLQFLSGEGVRSGVLANIQVTADPRTNSLLVSAPQQSMAMLDSLIRQLDIPAPTVADIKVFTLSNADAREMARLLDSLFANQSQQRQTGVQLAGAIEASTNLVPMRFTVDARTNSIIAKGSAEALRVAEAVLLRLDQNDLRQRRSHVFRLRNSQATDLADAINAFLGSKRELAQADTQLVSTIEQLEREVIVVAEPISNSLLISSTPRYFEEVQTLIQQLDEPAAQVNIQVLLVEVELDSNDEFGIELGIQDPVLFQRSVIDDLVTITTSEITPLGVPVTSEQIVSQTATPGFLFNNRPLGNNTTVRPGDVGSQGLSNFALGRSNSSLGYGGLVLSASSDAVSVLVRALAARRNVHILSRPQIRTLDNQQAQIQVGQQVPIVDGVTISQNNAATPLVRQDKAGIILTVTPRINPDGTVVMEVIAEKSQFAGQNIPLFVNSDGSSVGSPVKNITTARATVSVPNGQTIVLGGMITKVDVTDERKVPVLGDIPLLGRAFRYDATSSKRTELLMFLTPRVIRDPYESENVKRVEAERMHFFVEEAEKIHGPIFSVPESMPIPEQMFEDIAPASSGGYLPPVISVDQQ